MRMKQATGGKEWKSRRVSCGVSSKLWIARVRPCWGRNRLDSVSRPPTTPIKLSSYCTLGRTNKWRCGLTWSQVMRYNGKMRQIAQSQKHLCSGRRTLYQYKKTTSCPQKFTTTNLSSTTTTFPQTQTLQNQNHAS